MANAAASWRSKKQNCVSLSSSKTEYVSLSSAVRESIWLSNFLQAVARFLLKEKLKIHVENQGSIKMARNYTSGSRTKHIDIQYHFARHAYKKVMYEIDYISSARMIADIFTKPLTRNLFETFRSELGLLSSSTSYETTDREGVLEK